MLEEWGLKYRLACTCLDGQLKWRPLLLFYFKKEMGSTFIFKIESVKITWRVALKTQIFAGSYYVPAIKTLRISPILLKLQTFFYKSKKKITTCQVFYEGCFCRHGTTDMHVLVTSCDISKFQKALVGGLLQNGVLLDCQKQWKIPMIIFQ